MGVPDVALAPVVDERVEGVYEEAPVAVGHGQAKDGSECKAPEDVSPGVAFSEGDDADHERSRRLPGERM